MLNKYHSYNNLFTIDKDNKVIIKRNSIANINYIEIEKNLIKTASFIMNDKDSITQPSCIGINQVFSKCNVCNSNFPKNNNSVCSYKCYKQSKKNTEGFLIKCKNCKITFVTKNLFTDYCSDNCFTNSIKRYYTS
uniref:Uncharacterized protein n=1 Tax=viral metagenome TaxID=1070528 RepID=A0A6C0J004_9ZZZZ